MEKHLNGKKLINKTKYITRILLKYLTFKLDKYYKKYIYVKMYNNLSYFIIFYNTDCFQKRHTEFNLNVFH